MNKKIIEKINKWQARGDNKPVSCDNKLCDKPLVAVETNGKVVLKCKSCNYKTVKIPAFLIQG